MKDEYWMHSESEAIYAVRVGDDGTLKSARRPLHPSEITTAQGAVHERGGPAPIDHIRGINLDVAATHIIIDGGDR